MPERDPFLNDPVNRAAIDALLEAKLASDCSVTDQEMVSLLLNGPILEDVQTERKCTVAILAASRAFEMAEDIKFINQVL